MTETVKAFPEYSESSFHFHIRVGEAKSGCKDNLGSNRRLYVSSGGLCGAQSRNEAVKGDGLRSARAGTYKLGPSLPKAARAVAVVSVTGTQIP